MFAIIYEEKEFYKGKYYYKNCRTVAYVDSEEEAKEYCENNNRKLNDRNKKFSYNSIDI